MLSTERRKVMRSKLVLGAILCSLWSTPTVLMSQTPERAGAPDQLSLKNAVELVRRINTAEAELFMSTQVYVSMDKLVGHRLFANSQPTSNSDAVSNAPQATDQLSPTLIDSSSGKLKNYKVFVIVSPDGKHYQVAMVEATPRCASAVFSNESGVIYSAKALGCPPSETVNRPSAPGQE